jgi:hypothetical protein
VPSHERLDPRGDRWHQLVRVELPTSADADGSAPSLSDAPPLPVRAVFSDHKPARTDLEPWRGTGEAQPWTVTG